MADRRRRRKCANSDGSGSYSDDSEEDLLETSHHENASDGDGGNSEYESVDDDVVEEDADEFGAVIGNSDTVEAKKLDDDEDRKNPQYIPKKGTFYEHDDRTALDGEDVEEEKASIETEIISKEVKKRVWHENDKWQHDRFIETDQAPKSRAELVSVYGYDIRNEEGPPRARRKRRYGRGPNKYTRNWEDLAAYSKPGRGGLSQRGGRARGKSWGNSERPHINNEEEFPALVNEHQNDSGVIAPETLVEECSNHGNTDKDDNVSHKEMVQGLEAGKPKGGYPKSRGGKTRPSRLREFVAEESQSGQNTESFRGRGGRVARNSASHTSRNVEQLEQTVNEIKSMTISSREDGHMRKSRNSMEGKKNVPPRLQESAARSAGPEGSTRPKRYSSQRQRQLPDQNIPQFQQQQQQGFFEPVVDSVAGNFSQTMYNGNTPTTIPVASVVSLGHSVNPAQTHSFVPPAFTSPPTYSPEPFIARPPGPRMFPPAQQGPPHIIPAPTVAGAGTVPVPSIPAGVAGPVPVTPVTGPPFLPPENMLNYGTPHPGASQFPTGHSTGPYPGSPFQGFSPVVSQEIYSNGVTYYNTQNQQMPCPKMHLQKRPKAAIPIVAPPEMERNDVFRSENDYDDSRDLKFRGEKDEEYDENDDVLGDETTVSHGDEELFQENEEDPSLEVNLPAEDSSKEVALAEDHDGTDVHLVKEDMSSRQHYDPGVNCDVVAAAAHTAEHGTESVVHEHVEVLTAT